MPWLGAPPADVALSSSDLGDNIVTESKMANDAIGLAELKAGTDGELITWDASGNPVAVGAGSSGEFLKSQGAGSVPVFAAAGGGLVTQVQSATITGTLSTTSTTLTDMTGLTVTCTSLVSTDKVLITGSVRIGNGSVGDRSFFSLIRDTTEIGQGAAAGSRYRTHTNVINSFTSGIKEGVISFLDSPSATGSVTYKMQWRLQTGAGSTVYCNRMGVDSDAANWARCSSTINATVIDGS
jgi:hypothetical protein